MTYKAIFGMVLACALLASGVAWAAEPGADYFVSPGGNDGWSGKLAASNAGKTDGPFATIGRVQQAARALRTAEAERKRPVVIAMRGGLYSLAEALEFSAADSGTAASPTVYMAYGDERPVISGGVRISGWKKNEKGQWTVQIPEVAKGEWNFIQLFVNGQRRYRPRMPKNDYFLIADAMPPTEKHAKQGFDRFKFAGNDLRASWSNLGDVEVLAAHVWTMSRFRIASIDEAERVVTFTGATRHLQPWSSMPKGNRYLVENVKEALSEPGEWYLDRKSGVLTYIPMAGEEMDKTEVIAPRLEILARIKGEVAGQKWVQHLNFRGLTFAHANWVTQPEGNSFAQAEVQVSAAVIFSGARDCAMENCTVTHSGGYGIDFAEACRGNRLVGCELTDLGAGGVKIGLMRMEKNEELVTSHQTISDCLIAHGGRLHPAAVGVWIGHSPYNVIEHNEIADFYYTGISLGWTWGYGGHGGHHNAINYNHIHHFGQGVLSDMGGIYTLGLATGSVLNNNLIHDVDAHSYGGWGIYFDEGTAGIVAENNIVYRTKTGGFHQHYGKENIVRNNIFAFAKKDQIQRTRPEAHLSFTFERNIVYWNGGPLFGSNWSGNNYKLDSNLYWRTDGKPIEYPKMSLEEWKKKGQDVNTIVADPLFEKPEAGDFRLKAGSPAEKIGFKAIDASKAGRLTKRQPLELAPAAFPTRESK